MLGKARFAEVGQGGLKSREAVQCGELVMGEGEGGRKEGIKAIEYPARPCPRPPVRPGELGPPFLALWAGPGPGLKKTLYLFCCETNCCLQIIFLNIQQITS